MTEANEGGATAAGGGEGTTEEQSELQAEQDSADAMDAEVDHGADENGERRA